LWGVAAVAAMEKAIQRYADEVVRVIAKRAALECALSDAAARQMLDQGHGEQAATLAARITAAAFRNRLWTTSN
jgi:hypothetical protein